MKFSIITPSFNQLDWLRLCIASVADQVTLNLENEVEIEHIIQDGGSAGFDLFSQQMKELYSDRDGYSLRLISEKDSGMYDALNKGFKQAQGTIVAWLNCDEQYLPETLKKVSKLFTENPKIEILLGDALLIDQNHDLICYRRIMKPRQWHTRLVHLHSMSCAMFFKSTLIPKDGLFDSRWRMIGDAVLMDHWLSQKKSILASNELLSSYTVTGVNLSMNQRAKSEHTDWLKKFRHPPVCLRLGVIMLHHIERLLAGSYLKRKISVNLFDRTSNVRVVKTAKSLGWAWPKPPAA